MATPTVYVSVVNAPVMVSALVGEDVHILPFYAHFAYAPVGSILRIDRRGLRMCTFRVAKDGDPYGFSVHKVCTRVFRVHPPFTILRSLFI